MRRRFGLVSVVALAALVALGAPTADARGGGRLCADEPGFRPAGRGAEDRPEPGQRVGDVARAEHPFWVSDNGTDVSTLYNGDVNGSPVGVVPLVVGIPGGAPTGQVFNDTTAFRLPGTTTVSRFIFIGEDGDLSAWAGGTAATLIGHTDDAIYKGLALVHSPSGPMLLAANFRSGRIDVFDGTSRRCPMPGCSPTRRCRPATRRSTWPRSTGSCS